ncbi:hypothetical protein HMPREF3033_01434 [Veillonellaceae bacterium DNF00751]|nr:hypothetical protein HMPREF3033_01434 [Veillonellaceae bacterium DNF00751]
MRVPCGRVRVFNGTNTQPTVHPALKSYTYCHLQKNSPTTDRTVQHVFILTPHIKKRLRHVPKHISPCNTYRNPGSTTSSAT